jgi:hypothetical protein
MKLYKLTDENAQTHGGCQWGEGVTHTASGEGSLCDSGWIHAYEHPLLAVLHNPLHANFGSPRLWEAETTDENPLRDGQMKLGVRNLTTIREIPMPVITREQRVRYAILCAKSVCPDKAWNEWADNWLSGKDRSEESAAAVVWATAAWAATEWATWAAVWEWAVVWEWASWVARAAWAAVWEAEGSKPLDLISMAEKAINIEPLLSEQEAK